VEGGEPEEGLEGGVRVAAAVVAEDVLVQVVIDGAKALAKAVRTVLGAGAIREDRRLNFYSRTTSCRRRTRILVSGEPRLSTGRPDTQRNP
jgi:hypothetical protein